VAKDLAGMTYKALEKGVFGGRQFHNSIFDFYGPTGEIHAQAAGMKDFGFRI
jgi:hypothetical protein